MSRGIIAKASADIQAPVAKVWAALTDPEIIKSYMFGTQVVSDWKEGSPIVWKGEWKGKPYEDKGRILKLDPDKLLEYTHYSPLTGAPDVPDSYHTVRIELSQSGATTKVSLAQDNNTDDQARKHSEENWKAVLTGMKQLVEA